MGRIMEKVETYIHQIAILDDYTDFVLPKTTETILKSIPGKHILWDEESIISLLKDNFASGVLQAFNHVKANALKADLARYCILYVYGGWYFDLLMTVDGDLAHYNLNDYEMLVFRDIPIGDKTILPISNSIIWVRDVNNKVIKETIDHCVRNILNEVYPRTSHRITGPTIFGTAIARRCLDNENTNILVGDLSFCNENGSGEFTIVSWPQRKRVHFAWHKLPGLELDLPQTYQSGSKYHSMYMNKDLYKKRSV